jgi:hypothetical protein
MSRRRLGHNQIVQLTTHLAATSGLLVPTILPFQLTWQQNEVTFTEVAEADAMNPCHVCMLSI